VPGRGLGVGAAAAAPWEPAWASPDAGDARIGALARLEGCRPPLVLGGPGEGGGGACGEGGGEAALDVGRREFDAVVAEASSGFPRGSALEERVEFGGTALPGGITLMLGTEGCGESDAGFRASAKAASGKDLRGNSPLVGVALRFNAEGASQRRALCTGSRRAESIRRQGEDAVASVLGSITGAEWRREDTGVGTARRLPFRGGSFSWPACRRFSVLAPVFGSCPDKIGLRSAARVAVGCRHTPRTEAHQSRKRKRRVVHLWTSSPLVTKAVKERSRSVR